MPPPDRRPTGVTREDPDRDLLARVRSGDLRAAGELFERHIDRVRAHLFRTLGTTRDLDDLTQAVFLEVWRSLPRYRGDARFSTWLVRITINVAITHLRTAKRRPVLLSMVREPSNAPSAQRSVEHRELRSRLYSCLDRVKSKKRMAFILHAVMGYTIAEVGALTDSSERAVRAQVLRARKELAALAERDPVLGTWLDQQGTGGGHG